MEQKFDYYLDRIFGNMQRQILILNAVLGLLFIINGFIIIKKGNKRKIGLGCIIFGIIAIISGVIQCFIL